MTTVTLRKRLTAIGLCVGLVLLAPAAVVVGPKAQAQASEVLCDLQSGRWAWAQRVCVPRTCYRSGTCGAWAHPSDNCRRLRIGDTIDSVYFQLGVPAATAQHEYRWYDKGNFTANADVEATISGGRLQRLACR